MIRGGITKKGGSTDAFRLELARRPELRPPVGLRPAACRGRRKGPRCSGRPRAGPLSRRGGCPPSVRSSGETSLMFPQLHCCGPIEAKCIVRITAVFLLRGHLALLLEEFVQRTYTLYQTCTSHRSGHFGLSPATFSASCPICWRKLLLGLISFPIV